jgi:uncharacterized membrane protein
MVSSPSQQDKDAIAVPADRILNIVIIVLAVAGIAVAAYLTWSHYSHLYVLCQEGGGCDRVRQSKYSEVAGIPISVFGVMGYLGILGVYILEKISSFFADNGPILMFGLTLIGFLYSAYLTYLELFVIHAICPYCVSSAVIMTLLFVVAIYRMMRAMNAEEI